jgi:hypothetical protein
MKKLLLLAGIFLVMASSCDKVDELTHFNMDYNEDMTIPATFGIDIPIDIWTPDIPTNSTSTFESNNTHKDLIEEIVLKKMNLTIKSPESSTWDFLKKIEIYISADGLEEKKIAWLEDIPKSGLKSIDLNVSPDDLKEYIKKDEYKLRTKTVTRELISHDTQVEIKSTFFVDAKILGV